LKHRFIELLSTIRRELAPLTVDCRLRPEGKSGQLVWDIEAYASYFEKRIEVWELQSLTKLSFLYGDENLYSEFTAKYFARVASLDKETVRKAVTTMRKRLYPTSLSGIAAPVDIIKGRGGATDIEFIAQYLLLLNSGNLKFLIGKGNREIITALKAIGDLPEDQAEMLMSGFNFLKKIRFAVQSVYQTGNNQLPSKQKGEILYKFLNFESYDDLVKAVQSILKQNNEIFHQILTG
jgi:glutamate-ammonia-ligase adenylyltransferase